MRIEIMDTTLRDGEQTTGLSFSESEKLNITKLLLEEVKVDRVEIASARVSEGERRAVRKVMKWAKENGFIDNIEVLGFVDGKISVDWIIEAGGRVINLLTKGSLKHVQGQLRKSPEEHISDIREVVKYAETKSVTVNVYLEDWSNGMINSREYVYKMIDALKEMPVKRIMLPDTLGILNQVQVKEMCEEVIKKYPDIHFDFHAHNDYDLAIANVFSALGAGIKGIHTTVNGLGERAGNAPLSSVLGVIKDHTSYDVHLNEKKLNIISKLVESFSGIRIPNNKPLIGEYVFTQCSGVHADGDNKDNLYFNNLMPERFGRVRKYALGKTSGKANIKNNLEELGIELDDVSLKKVTDRIIELGDKKENVSTEDLPYILADVLHNEHLDKKINIKNYSMSLTYGLKPVASVNVEIEGECYQETSFGDGQYDAFMKALWKIYTSLDKNHPVLVDYTVTIPPGGKSNALVETIITWNFNNKEFKTRGLDADQTEAAIKATSKMLNLIENGIN